MIHIDGIIFSLQRHGGISVYFRELLDRIRRDERQAILTLDGLLRQDPPAGGAQLVCDAREGRTLERYRNCRMPSKARPSLFHSTYYRRPADRALKTVVSVHDFTYERCDSGLRRFVHSRQKFAAIRAAQAVICISQSTRDDLEELVGVRPDQTVHVIHNGVSETFRPLGLLQEGKPFVLFVGQRGGYKNFALTVQALMLLPGIELCCVGGGALEASELAHVPEAVRRRVRHAGFVTDDELNELYNTAICLVYPSRYEGFGIPVIEAMRAGCPVVSLDCKAVVEVGGAALTVSDPSPRGLADAIRQTLDSEYRSDRIRKGIATAQQYSWERCYRQTVQVYDQMR